MMNRATAATLALLLAAAAGRAQDAEERKVEVGGLLDVRGAATDDSVSFLDGGLGRTRYGAKAGEAAEVASLAQASLLLDAHLSEVFGAHVQVNLDAEPENGGRRGKVGLVEAFVRYRPELSPHFKLRTRLGLFFPPISLEHPNRAWSTEHTLTPSAINAWVGEELRAAGGELSAVATAGSFELTGTGAVFGTNDPAGTLLAWRGWALHDRQTATGDQLPLARIPSLLPGGLFPRQAAWVEPIREVDGRLGYYAGGGLRHSRWFEATAMHWANRGRREVFDGFQYAWNTWFDALGLELRLPGKVQVLAQAMEGYTQMGETPDGAPMVDAEFKAWYAMASVGFGRHRLAARYDSFEVVDQDRFRAEDDNRDEGDAVTASYSFRFNDHARVFVEAVRVTSDHPYRAAISLPVHAVEDQLQLSLRISF